MVTTTPAFAMISRRPAGIRPLAHLAAACLAAAAGPLAAEPLFPGMPGVVSYTYREQFKADVPATLDVIRGLGITDIEFSNLFGLSPAALRTLLDERGMTCSSFGVGYDDARDKTDEVARDAKALGARYVRVASIPHKPPFTLEVARRAAADFNRVGRRLREQHGLTFCYHNHGQEFVPHGDGTLFDVIAAETDPQDVSFELDILWAHFAGVEPAALLAKYGNRFKLMHLKDLRQGVKGDLSGSTLTENVVTLGTGQIDIPAVLRAARKAGVRHFYIEDESQRIAMQVPASIAYLRSLETAGGTPAVRQLRHVVLFRFKPDSTPEDVAKIVAGFRGLPEKIKEIRAFEWGTDVSPEGKAAGFTHCFLVTFASAADRDAYLPHPAHQDFVGLVGPHVDKVCVVDFWSEP
jgi:sugar phosphate isomerase/epimerase